MYAVVTGASSGLGEVIADNLRMRYAYKVIAVGRRHPLVVVDSFWHADLTKLKDIKQIAIRMKTVPISLLINNAGAMLNITDAESINLHLMAPNILMDAMKGYHHTMIINIASVSGIKGEADFPIYSACKAGLIALTKSYAKRYAHKSLVNCISPGFFETHLFPDPTPQKMLDEQTVLGFEAKPHMILPAIDMLLNSRYTTGSNIIVDGGSVIK